MPKSIEELRRLLEETKGRIDKSRAAKPPAPAAPANTGERRPAAAGPRDAEPDKTRRPPSVAPGPQAVRPAAPSEAPPPAVATPRLYRDEAPIPHRPVEPYEAEEPAASGGYARMLAAALAAVAAGAGIFLDNRPVLFVAFVILCACAAVPSDSGDSAVDSRGFRELRAKLATLERRVASLSVPQGGGAPGALEEELQEIRTLVKSLFDALRDDSAESSSKEGRGGDEA